MECVPNAPRTGETEFEEPLCNPNGSGVVWCWPYEFDAVKVFSRRRSMSDVVFSEPHIATALHDRVTGMDVRVDRVGTGSPIVILNGLLGQNDHWFGVVQKLAKVGECILIQPPLLEMKGKGCSVDGVTALTTSLIESLVDEAPVIVGNSLGGHVALRIALANQDLPRGLVLVGSSGLFERTFERDWQHSPSVDYMQRKIEELFDDAARIPDGMVDVAHGALSRRSAARALVKLGRSAKRDHLGEELHRIECPVLLSWGRQDRVTPAEVAEQFHQLIPNSRLDWLERCGHAPQIERADELSESIGRFVNDLHAGAFGTRANDTGSDPGFARGSDGGAETVA